MLIKLLKKECERKCISNQMDLHAETPQNDLHTNNIKEQIKHHETRILQYCLQNSVIFLILVFTSFVTFNLLVNRLKVLYKIYIIKHSPLRSRITYWYYKYLAMLWITKQQFSQLFISSLTFVLFVVGLEFFWFIFHQIVFSKW